MNRAEWALVKIHKVSVEFAFSLFSPINIPGPQQTYFFNVGIYFRDTVIRLLLRLFLILLFILVFPFLCVTTQKEIMSKLI
jgi:uncharacterized membrane protein